MHPVPRSLDDLDAAWLDAALAGGAPDPANSLDVEVTAIDVVPLGADAGLLGDLARLHLTYGRGHGPATLIVKLPASDPGGRHVGTMLRAWAREVAFYTEVAPASPGVKVPRCHHVAADEAAATWVVVLEDCPAVAVDVAVGASQAQVEAAVDALAGFHGAWWGSGQSFGWMPGFDSTGVGGLQQPWLDSLPVFLERYGHVVPSPTDAWIQTFAPRLTDWSARVATEPLTVVHADFRVDNLVFDPDGSGVTMIDWQTALRGPAAMDLTSFVVTGLTVEQRRDLEGDLIARYLDALAVAGVRIDAEWFARSYDENLLWWMGQFANNLAHLQPDDRITQASLDTMIERTYTAALDREVGRLLD